MVNAEGKSPPGRSANEAQGVSRGGVDAHTLRCCVVRDGISITRDSCEVAAAVGTTTTLRSRTHIPNINVDFTHTEAYDYIRAPFYPTYTKPEVLKN